MLIVGLCVTSLMLVGAFLSADENDEIQKLQYFTLIALCGSSCISLSILILISCACKNLFKYANLSVLVPQVIISYIVYQVNDDESNMSIAYFMMGVYGVFSALSAILLTADYLASLCMRIFCALAFYGRAALLRQDPIHFTIVIMICFLIMESIVHLSQREKALLFLKLKQTTMQEEYIQMILKSLPERLMISSLADGKNDPRCIYSNRLMN